MKPEDVKNKKDFMIFMLVFLNDENRQVGLGEAFFGSGYSKGMDSFTGAMNELEKKGWINIITTPSFDNSLGLHTNSIKYEITFEGIEYLSSIGKAEDLHPKKEVSELRGNSIVAKNLIYNENSKIGNQSSSFKNKTTKQPAKDETKIIKNILIGLFITIIGGLILWFITTYLTN